MYPRRGAGKLESRKVGDMGGNFYLDIRPILHSYSFSQATKTTHSQIKREGVQSLAQCSILDCHVIFPRYALPMDKSQPRLPQELTITTTQIQECDTTHPTAESAIS